MRRTGLPSARTWWAVFLAVFLSAGLAWAQAGTPTLSEPATWLSELLRQGHQLELDRRWGEAMAYYEDAIRQYPNESSLQRRFDFTRLHFDLSRRYNDQSFRSLLDRLSTDEAIGIYAEVLLKVQSHYVEAPNWKNLVERGMNDLDVALGEPVFLESCRSSVDSRMLDGLRQELRRTIGPQVIQNRNDARDAVLTAANLTHQWLGLPPVRIVLEFACGATNTLDPYSTYLTPNQLTEVYSQIEGNFVGLGVELKGQGDTLVILRVISHSPAERSGIRAGDRIVAVDGRLTNDLSTDRAANLLQGPAGSVVQLTLLDPEGKTRTVSSRRERVEVPSVDEVQIVDRSQGVGYLKLTCFQKTTAQDLDNALWSLHRAGMRSLVMDLRGNPGGLLVAAVEVADRFLDQGIIVSTRGRNLQEDLTYSAHEAGTWRVPLVVLIDQDSASAAEIFAGAIRDHHRGTIVGRRSYGKGSVQGIFPLSANGAGVRLTTAKFYSPLGRPYSSVGVEPHISVHQVAKPVTAGPVVANPATDPVLAAGIQAVQQFTAQR